MKELAKKFVIMLVVISMIFSSTNAGVLIALAEDISAIISYVEIKFIDPDTGNTITEAEVKQDVRLSISFGVASNIDTENTSIRIDIDNDNFYFKSFTPNGETDGAEYSVEVNTGEIRTAVLHIDEDGTRYITIDGLTQGETVHLSLDGYFKDVVTENEEINVSVNGNVEATLTATGVENKITVSNSKTVSTTSISFHEGDEEELAANFPITYNISSNITIPDYWSESEELKNVTISDTLTFPDGMYVNYDSNFEISDYIGLGTSTVLTTNDFSPILSTDGTKVIGIQLTKELTGSDIDTYLTNGEEIKLKYNENLVVEKDGSISNSLSTSYTSTNYEDSASPSTVTTSVDKVQGPSFTNASKTINWGESTSSTANWGNGYLLEGDTITYEFSIQNQGDEAGDISITDIIPEGTELVSATSSNTSNITETTVTVDGEDKDAVIWNFSNVGVWQTVTGKITLKITDDATFNFENNIYETDAEDDTPIATSPEVSVQEKKPANFENSSKYITSSESKNFSGGAGWTNGYLLEGDTITYKFSVTNTGDEAGDVTITDIIPEGTELVSATSSYTDKINTSGSVTVGEETKDAVIWTFENVEPGATITGEITLKVTNNADYKITNNIYEGTDYENPEATSPEATVQTRKEATFENSSKHITSSESKNFSGGAGWTNGYLLEGDTITYKFSVTNTGDEAGDVTITDIIPEGTELVSATSSDTSNINTSGSVTVGEETKDAVIWTFEDVEAGATVTGEITLKVTEDANYTITNNIYEGTDYENSEATSETAQVNEKKPATFENASKYISSSDGKNYNNGNGYLVQGETVTYVVSVTNTGDVAGDITITDIIPEGTELVSATSSYASSIDTSATVTVGEETKDAVIWTFENVEAGATVTGEITIKVTDNADFTFINNIYIGEDYTESDASSNQVTVKTMRPELGISKTAVSSGGKYSNPEDTVTYTITVTNTGSSDITTNIVDILPTGLENITCTDQENATIEDGKITWSDVTIAVGATLTYEVTGTVAEGTTGTITNTAKVDEDGEYEKTATATTEVFDEETAMNSMEITKSVDKTIVSKGDTVTYTIKLRNLGSDFNIEDLAEEKITITDVIPEGLNYLGNAYYILPWQSTHLTDGISYDETTKTLTCNIESSVYSTFASYGELFLYIPCEVTAETNTNADTNIDNTASSSTLNKNSNTVTVTIPKPSGLNFEKYVYEVYDNSNKDNILYKNNQQTNTEEVNVDLSGGNLVHYRVKISNTGTEDITLDSSNGTFTDNFTGLDAVSVGSDYTINILNSKEEQLGTITRGYWGELEKSYINIDLTGYTIPANDYIILSYELVAKTGSSKVTNIISNTESESSAQEITSRSSMDKQVALVDKNTNWSGLTKDSFKDFEFKDTSKIIATQLQDKYLMYKIYIDPGTIISDTFIITDTISDNLKFVTDLSSTNFWDGHNGPIVGITKKVTYNYNYSDEGLIQNKPTVEINGQTLNITFTPQIDNAIGVESYVLYYLVEVDEEILQSMIDDINNSIDVEDIDLINTVNVKSTLTNEDGSLIIDETDTTTITVNDGELYPGIEKEYIGFFAPGDIDLDSEGNVELSNGSANAGASLVWKVTVKNEDKESAKDLRNYSVKEILPENYIFDNNYLNSEYLGAKYYPSIVIYDADGNEVKSWKGANFILPTGYDGESELNWNFTGEEYYLKPGYRMEIIFATRVKNAGTYGAFLNTAQLISNTEVSKENVSDGVVLDESTLQNTAFANIYSHMTTSYKEIEYNPDLYDADYEQPSYDTGISSKDSEGVLDNYVQGHQGEVVKYTLNITNESKVNIKDLVIIDRMPYVGDIGVIAKYERDSAFEVKWDSFIKAEIYDKDGNYSRTISSDNIGITFSDEKNAVFEYSAGDWLGNDDVATWSSEANDNTVNVRFMIDYDESDSTTYLEPGETLKISFYGRVPEYVEKTGETNIAWNNFAYGYKAYNATTGNELSSLSIAEPAKVGVWVAEQENSTSGAITINKKYNSLAGETTAYFVLYKYNEEYDSTSETSQEYIKYSSVISVSVAAGETVSYTFENLPSGTTYIVYETDKDGNILDAQNNDWYTIDGQGTTVSLAAGENKQVNVTNTALPEFKGSVKISKIAQSSDGESVTTGEYTFVIKNDADEYVYLKDGVITTSAEFVSDALITVTAGQSKTIDGLDIGKYKIYEVDENGINVNSVEDIGYTVEFSPSNSFEITRADGNKEITATNTLEEVIVETVEISGTKTWEDAENQDGVRPESITVNLLANGTEVKEVVVTSENNWTYEFTNLDKYSNGVEIVYTVTEDKVEGYTSSVDGYDITNTHTPEVTSVSGTKTWEDAENQDGVRPESITVNLLADGVEVDEVEVTEENNWTYEFTNLDKYSNGVEIVYTVTEDEVDGYTSSVDGYDITNTHTPEVTSVSGTKTWEDAENQDGVRPESITVNLLADGVEVDEVEVTEANNWTYEFTNLDKYSNGIEIVYTVTEDEVDGYTSSVDGYDITNSYTPETTEVSVEKVWNDNDDQDGKRPESIKVQLKANGSNVGEEVELTNSKLTYTWSDLAKYENGTEITYTVVEVTEVADYTTETTKEGNKTIITNSYTPGQTSITVNKVWADSNNQDGKRPTSVKVQLKADGALVEEITLTAGDDNTWSEEELTYTWTELAEYKDGNKITYTVEEVEVADGYEVSSETVGSTTTITNTYETEVTSVSGTKTWEDAENQDGVRPESITVNLLANGKEVKEVVVTSENDWTYEFNDLPKYEDGQEIVYTVTEDEVEGYTSSVDGYDITNTHTPEVTSVSGTKTWEDAENQDGKRPTSIKVNLLANGVEVDEVEVTEANNWTYEFTNLDKYSNGVEIVYTVTEDKVEGYTSSVDGYDITNTYTPEVTSVSGTKTWEDADDQDGKRPTSIKVNLLANGVEVDEVEVTEANNWTYEFTNLDKYSNGVEIVYTVTEDEVEGYTSSVDGYDITNTYTPEVTSVSGTKTWEDAENQDGKRPTSITVNLLADGVEVDEVEVTEENNWTYEFTNLDKYSNGVEIVYTVTEDEVDGYTSSVDGYDITNTHTPEVTSVSGTKTWEDAENQDGKRPTSIKVNLLANGVEVDEVEVTEANNWTYEFTNLDKYSNGVEIVYTVTEDEVDGYTSSVNGYDITNTYTPETTEVTVEKVWNDNDDQDGKRPESIKVQLKANGSNVGEEIELTNSKLTYTWSDLAKYENGTEITYTVVEVTEVADYTTETTKEGNKVTITNTYTTTTSVEGTKTWVDYSNIDNTRPESITINLIKNGTIIDSKEVTAENGWKYSFTDLEKYDAQNELIEYAISEDAIPNYTVEINGYDVINTYVAKTSIKGVKVWDDNDNKDNTRPESITVNLLKDGLKIKSIVVAKDDNWEYEFKDLLKYNDDGTEIKYTIEEEQVEGYKSEVIGTNIINTYIPKEDDDDTDKEDDEQENDENDDEKDEEVKEDTNQDLEENENSESIKTGDNIWFNVSSLITSLITLAYVKLRKRK